MERIPDIELAIILRQLDTFGTFTTDVPDQATGERLGELFLHTMKSSQRKFSWWIVCEDKCLLTISELRPEVLEGC